MELSSLTTSHDHATEDHDDDATDSEPVHTTHIEVKEQLTATADPSARDHSHDSLDLLRPLLIILSIPFTTPIGAIICTLMGCILLLPLIVAFLRQVYHEAIGMINNANSMDATPIPVPSSDPPHSIPVPPISPGLPDVASSHNGVRWIGWFVFPLICLFGIVGAIIYSALVTLILLPLSGIMLGTIWIPLRMLHATHVRDNEFNPISSLVQGLTLMVGSWMSWYDWESSSTFPAAAAPSMRHPIHPLRYLAIPSKHRFQLPTAASASATTTAATSIPSSTRIPVVHPSTLSLYVAVALGGAVGSMLRYAFSSATSSIDRLESVVTSPMTSWSGSAQPIIHPSSTSFIPVSTLIANLLGCIMIGILSSVLSDPLVSKLVSPLYRPFLVTGLCGGLTTFSSVLLETLELIFQSTQFPSRWWMPIVNILLHHVACILLVLFSSLVTEEILPLLPIYQTTKRGMTATPVATIS